MLGWLFFIITAPAHWNETQVVVITALISLNQARQITTKRQKNRQMKIIKARQRKSYHWHHLKSPYSKKLTKDTTNVLNLHSKHSKWFDNRKLIKDASMWKSLLGEIWLLWMRWKWKKIVVQSLYVMLSLLSCIFIVSIWNRRTFSQLIFCLKTWRIYHVCLWALVKSIKASDLQ